MVFIQNLGKVVSQNAKGEGEDEDEGNTICDKVILQMEVLSKYYHADGRSQQILSCGQKMSAIIIQRIEDLIMSLQQFPPHEGYWGYGTQPDEQVN